MRISARQAEVFSNVLQSRIGSRAAELYLFGSRTKDNSKGGDIDLLVLASAPVLDDLRREKHFILSEFKKELGDRRIDLTLAERSRTKNAPFIKKALNAAILLKKWGPF